MGDTVENQELSEDESKMLAEWENVNSQGGMSNKDLDQSEIDNLLGFSVQQGEANNKGIKAMIDKALDSYERLPMLEVVFEKFIRLLSTSLRNLAEDNVELDIKSIQSMRFGTYINSIPIPTLVNVFRAVEWDHYGLFVANNSLIFSFIDILFGGKKAKKPVKIEGRPYTTIEQSLVRQLSNIILRDLSEAFETLSSISFTFERMESDPRFVSIARYSDSISLITIGVEIEDKKGSFEILLPYDALEPIRKLLTQVFIGEQFAVDYEWRHYLTNNLLATSIELEARLIGKVVKVDDIMNLKVGNTVMMQNSPDDDIMILCNGKEVSSGKLGKVGRSIAIELNEPLKTEGYKDD